MKSNNYQFPRPQPQQTSNEEQQRSQLSYSILAKQIDDQEEMISQQEANFQLKNNNICVSNKNTPFISEPSFKAQMNKCYGSQHTGFKYTPQLLEKMPIQSPMTSQPQGGRLGLHSYGNSLIGGNGQINNTFQTTYTSFSDAQFLVKPDQNRSFRPKVLGEKIVNSMIMKQSDKNNDSIGIIQEQSLVLPASDQDQSIQHFAAASFDTSEDKSVQLQQNSNQNNIVITVTQSKCNPHQLIDKQRLPENAPTQLPKEIKEEVSNEHVQFNSRQEPSNQVLSQPRNKAELHNQSHCKLTKSKVIVPGTEKEVIASNIKQESAQKKICKVQVPTHMKSTYDPIKRKSEYKQANGGNLSEPGKRESKVQIKKIEEPELSNETQSEALKYQKQKYSRAVIVGLQNIQKEIAFISDNNPKTQQQIPHRREQSVQEQYRKPTTRKIEMMKNLAPEELFNGFSSVETNQRQRRRQENKQKNLEYSSILLEQIQNLKKKINYLEKVSSSRRESSREQHRLHGLSIEKIQTSRTKRISINYKEYNQTSLAKVLKKKSISLRKDFSSEISISEDEFIELQMFAHMLKAFPKAHNSAEELVELSLQVFENFGIEVNRFTSIDVTKFKDGVQFQIKEDLTLIWYYEGELYLGETVNRTHGYAQLEGEGILIQPNCSCYKGSFSKDKKSGFGIYYNANGEKYKGEWKHDLYHGRGKLITQISEYQGYFLRGLKEGQGYELFSNGDSYEGEYQAGKFNGRGKYVWKNKTQYVGDFRNGFMEGEGVWKSKKDSYQGQYYKNMKHGYGTYRWGNGRVYEGKFQHGHRVTKTTHNKPTIAVQKQITYDLEMDNDNESQLYELQINNEGRAGKRRFTIESTDGHKLRKGSKFTLLKN